VTVKTMILCSESDAGVLANVNGTSVTVPGCALTPGARFLCGIKNSPG